jgi:hypothetical protein
VQSPKPGKLIRSRLAALGKQFASCPEPLRPWLEQVSTEIDSLVKTDHASDRRTAALLWRLEDRVNRFAGAKEAPPVTVLFIGSSLTGAIPKVLSGMSRTAGEPRPVEYVSEIKGGTPVGVHRGIFPTREAMHRDNYDYVSLNMGSLDRHPGEAAGVEAFAREAREAGATPLYYVRYYMLGRNDSKDAFMEAARTMHAKYPGVVVPGVLSFAAAHEMDPKMVLHKNDKVHPNPRGVYILASTFYSVLYGKSVTGFADKLVTKSKRGYPQAKELDEAKRLAELAYKKSNGSAAGAK